MLKYPNDLNETQSDSITFAHSPYRPNKGGDFFGSGTTASVPANVSEMIRLYVPNSTPAINQSNNWGRRDFEGEVGAARLNAIRAITNGINNIGGEGDFAGALKDAGDTVGSFTQDLLDSGGPALKQIGTQIAGSLANLSPSQALAVSRGQVYNPNVELLYSSPVLRQFSFEFNFVPRSAIEAAQVNSIIKEFKIWSAPKADGNYLKVPDIWHISYGNTTTAKYMNKFKPCAMQSFELQDNASSNAHYTFIDGVPVSTAIRMAFKEVDIITREDHENGGARGF